MNEELGSKRLGLFRLRDAGMPARGECLLKSDMRGEAGLTVLGDGFRDVCFDIILGNGVDERVRGSKGSRLKSYYSDIDARKALSLAWVFLDGRLNGDQEPQRILSTSKAEAPRASQILSQGQNSKNSEHDNVFLLLRNASDGH